ncbi:MAG: hypothetical protein J5737_03665 [Bacteroidales bacterium]|nr:hypothetical protein [Bacteroidales bacterium]
MEENFDALEVIARTRGKVSMDDRPRGNYLFPLWGWLTAFFYLLEFLLWQWLHLEWCLWLWVGIPLVGIPLTVVIINKDHERNHMRTRRSKLVLDYWIFASFAIGLGGFLFGFTGVYEIAENPLICFIVGLGAFITGEELRFRPMIVGGLTGAAIGIGAFVLQGELWTWQMLCIVLCAVSALIIPGYLFERNSKHGA